MKPLSPEEVKAAIEIAQRTPAGYMDAHSINRVCDALLAESARADALHGALRDEVIFTQVDDSGERGWCSKCYVHWKGRAENHTPDCLAAPKGE